MAQRAWTSDELDTAVAGYLSLLRDEKAGRPINKAEMNRQLRRVLSGRSRGSVEFRMANISSVLRREGLDYIKGYQPRSNVGKAVEAMILAALRRNPDFGVADVQPEDDETKLREKANRARRRGIVGVPSGQQEPQRGTASHMVFKRDPLVRAWVLEHARGKCELCANAAPFLDVDGFPFLEVHHVKPLADGGADTIANAVALCPNCHRRCHQSQDRKECTSRLGTLVRRLSE